MNPTRPTRVLVVSGTSASRARLAKVYSASGEFEVVGEARAVAETIAVVRSTRAELVVLDTADREQAQTFAALLMAESPTPILGVDASGAIDEVRAAMLELGVVDVIDARGADANDSLLRTGRLVARIRVVTRRAARTMRSPLPPAVVPTWGASALPGVVAVGASTGGPSAVSEFLKQLPRTMPLPVLIVVHIGPSFGHSLADWLDLGSGIPVHQAADGMKVELGHAYVCPPDRHLVLRNDHLGLTSGPERHSCRPSVDILFESVAEELGERSIGCLMTGIGRDGASGLLEMHRRGALTIAQDESSCAVFGMPREAIALGAANLIAPPGRMAAIAAAHATRLAHAAEKTGIAPKP